MLDIIEARQKPYALAPHKPILGPPGMQVLHDDAKLPAKLAADVFSAELVTLMPFLRALACTLCGNRDQARDLSQEALMKAWQSRASFEPGTNLKAWLFTILRNQFYSEKRRSWRHAPWDEAAAELSSINPGAQHASTALSDVSRAVGLLPNEQRKALILVGVGGFAYGEAAAIAGCAIGTVKSRVARARRAIERTIDSPAPLTQPRPACGGAMTHLLAELDSIVPARSVGFAPK